MTLTAGAWLRGYSAHVPAKSRPVTLDAGFDKVGQPGVYAVELLVLEDTPYRNDAIGVMLKATPPLRGTTSPAP